MGFNRLAPGCCCGGIPCIEWDGSRPLTLQLTLPGTCERAGDYVLTQNDGHHFWNDCHNTSPFTMNTQCGYRLRTGSGANQDTLNIAIGQIGDDTVIVASVCNELGGPLGTDTGTVWGMTINTVDDWSQLDGLSIPFSDRATGSATTNDGDTYCSDPVGNAIVTIPP